MRGKMTSAAMLALLGAWACSGDSPGINPAPVESGGVANGGSGGAAGSGVGGSEAGGSGGEQAGGSAGSAGDAGSAGSAGAAGSAGSSTGPVVRTVIVRDVFEHFDDPDNLMLDGGFELSGEMGNTWGVNAYGPMKFGNGAICRSGVRCGIASVNKGIYGFFVSARTGKLGMSVRAKPDGASCSALSVYAFDAYSNGYPKQVSIASAELGADGWCEIKGGFDALPFAVPMLYLEPSQGRMIIDDVVVTTTVSTFALPAPAKPVSAATRVRLEQASKHALRLLQGAPGTRRSLRAGAPWTAEIDPWIR